MFLHIFVNIWPANRYLAVGGHMDPVVSEMLGGGPLLLLLLK